MDEQADSGEPNRGWGIALALAVVGLVVGAVAFEPALSDLGLPSFVDRFGALRLGAALGFGLTGAALVATQPRHRLGWLMTGIGIAQALSMFVEAYGLLAVHDTDAGLSGGGWGIALAAALWAPAYLAVPTLFLLLFPDGSVPGPRWRPLAMIEIAALVMASVGWFLVSPSEYDIDIYPPGYDTPAPTWVHADVLTAIAAVIAVPAALASIASLVVRYRRATRAERAPLGWVLVGALVTAALLVSSFFAGAAGPWIAGLAMIPLPLAVAIGVGQHGLWDSDGLLRRTLAGGALSGTLLLVYVGIVALAGATFERTTAGASLVATAVVAVILLPVHRRATRWANQLVYGAPEEPSAVVRRLGAELDSAARPGGVLASMCSTVMEATGAAYVAVVVDDAVLAEAGEPTSECLTVPLQHAREDLGRLVVGGLPEPRRTANRRLLDDLAPHIALAARALQLELEIARSHARLVAAREDERQRLQRDLHDGVGPMMAALALELDRARLVLAHDPKAGEQAFDELAARLREAVRAVRSLVQDLRPPPLDELGLVGALDALGRQLAPTAPTIRVTATGLDQTLPADIELAAYRIASEAMTNVVRHADATACEVSLLADEAQLIVAVRDDGRGIGEAAAGTGRSSMRARAEEHGGSLAFDGGSDGTTVTAVLPLIGVPAR